MIERWRPSSIESASVIVLPDAVEPVPPAPPPGCEHASPNAVRAVAARPSSGRDFERTEKRAMERTPCVRVADERAARERRTKA
jgi:hypothetical protein